MIWLLWVYIIIQIITFGIFFSDYGDKYASTGLADKKGKIIFWFLPISILLVIAACVWIIGSSFFLDA